MTERKRFEIWEERIELYVRDKGICQSCNKPVGINNFEIAHCICKSKANRRKFGAHVINHPLNKRVTHPGRCNDAMNCGNNPAACAAIVRAIALDDEARAGV